ncbi:MAG: hypothetical protein PWQ57_805 [Desulfovibrionales bacterium]|jgi:murein L,D-transpeptidase YcbB/YkuD|nr:hypothetical protein [Desulfovibrionales bacterium]
MSVNDAAAVFKAINDKSEEAREAALFEVKNLKKDLSTLERILSGAQKKMSVSPFDIVHSAFETFHHLCVLLENQKLAELMEQDLGEAKAHAFLESHGATLLKKPRGWHWISPDGEMHLLGKAEEPDKAAAKLETLVSKLAKPRRGGKAKSQKSNTSAQNGAAPPAEPGEQLSQQ